MMRSKRFEPIEQIASNAATELSRAVGEAGRKVDELETQLVTLRTFRDEYASGGVAVGSETSSVILQNYRSFLDRLGEALRQHVIKLEKARTEYERRRLVWSAKRIEVESLKRVIERFRKEEQYAVDQREQREGDAAGMRISLAATEGGKP